MARRALAVCALCSAAGVALAAAPAPASRPGVRLISDRDPGAFVTISRARISAAADVRSRTYTLRSSPGEAGRRLTLTGLSIRGLLRLGQFDPDGVKFISIARANSLARFEHADFAESPPFAEGPALVTDEGGRTRFFRPVRGPTDTNAQDNVLSTATEPLDMTVGGGALLAVRASASPRRTAVGRRVRFRASVRFPPAGASFRYEWDFGDRSGAGVGAEVTHSYAEDGDFPAQVTVQGSGGSGALCRRTCGDVASVSVRVGKRRVSARPGTRAGGASGAANGLGASASGRGAGGSGGTGGSSRDGQPRAKARSASRGRKQPTPHADAGAGAKVSGILLANSPTALASSLPPLRRTGGQSAAARAARRGARGGGRLGGSLALTLVLITAGALHERRRGTLALA